jgi:hypothetical protein
VGAEHRDREARDALAGRKGRRAGLEPAELTRLGSAALREDEDRDAALEELPRHTGPFAVARTVDREGVEEQGREQASGGDVEEVVRRDTGGEEPRESPWHRTDDERGVEVGLVVRDDDERTVHPGETLAARHADASQRPDERLQQEALCDEARVRVQG